MAIYDEQPDKEWWKDQGRETVAKGLQTLIETHKVPPDEAKRILEETFWAAMAECGQ
jgi:hypothetical protein